LANVVVLNLNHFGGNGVGIGINLDGGEEVFWKHFNDVVVVRARNGVRVRVVVDSFDKWWRYRIGGSWGRGRWPNRRFWQPY
jgi:hypothetical protein